MSTPDALLTGLSQTSAALGLTRSMTHALRAQGFDLAAALFGAPDAAFERLPSQAQPRRRACHTDGREPDDSPPHAQGSGRRDPMTHAALPPKE